MLPYPHTLISPYFYIHRQFTDSVASLQGHDIAKAASDPSASRVIDALLEGTAPAKV
jgi:nucleolar protein 9